VEQPAFDAIAAHLEAAQRLAATIAFEVAWRCKSEVLTLMWNKVDLDEGRIYLDEAHSKNGKARHAYLSPSTISMLRAQRARVETLQQEMGRIIPDVFVHLEKGRWQGQRIFKFDDAWRTACRKAGYPGVLIHDLRRSGVRALVRSGTLESVAMRISGHETRSIFDRYNITSDQNLRDARDRRTQFGHNEGGKVVSIAR
jgi:integrase